MHRLGSRTRRIDSIELTRTTQDARCMSSMKVSSTFAQALLFELVWWHHGLGTHMPHGAASVTPSDLAGTSGLVSGYQPPALTGITGITTGLPCVSALRVRCSSGCSALYLQASDGQTAITFYESIVAATLTRSAKMISLCKADGLRSMDGKRLRRSDLANGSEPTSTNVPVWSIILPLPSKCSLLLWLRLLRLVASTAPF